MKDQYIIIMTLVYIMYYGLFTVLAFLSEYLGVNFEFINERIAGYLLATTLGYISFCLGILNTIARYKAKQYTSLNLSIPSWYHLAILVIIIVSLAAQGPYVYGVSLSTPVALLSIAFAVNSVLMMQNQRIANNVAYVIILSITAIGCSIYLKHKGVLLIIGALLLARALAIIKLSFLTPIKATALAFIVFLIYNATNMLRDGGDYQSLYAFESMGEFIDLNISAMNLRDIYLHGEIDGISLLNEVITILPSVIRPDVDSVAVAYAKYHFGSNYSDGLGLGINPYDFAYNEFGIWSLLMLYGMGYIVGRLVRITPLIGPNKAQIINAHLLIVLILFSRGGVFSSMKEMLIIVGFEFIIIKFYTGILIKNVHRNRMQ
jgi:hypothetical protein